MSQPTHPRRLASQTRGTGTSSAKSVDLVPRPVRTFVPVLILIPIVCLSVASFRQAVGTPRHIDNPTHAQAGRGTRASPDPRWLWNQWKHSVARALWGRLVRVQVLGWDAMGALAERRAQALVLQGRWRPLSPLPQANAGSRAAPPLVVPLLFCLRFLLFPEDCGAVTFQITARDSRCHNCHLALKAWLVRWSASASG